jgi:diguanylate cyclase (GGDEF)-like protein
MSEIPQVASRDAARVVVVEHGPEHIPDLQAALAQAGHAVVTATPDTALRMMATGEVTCIMLHVRDDGDAFRVAAQIRSTEHGTGVPVLFIVDSVQALQNVRMETLGIVDFALRPVLPQVLRAKLQVFGELHRMRSESDRARADRAAREADRRMAERRQAMEHAITRVLAESSTANEAMLKVIETICTSLGWDYGARWEWDPRSGLLKRRESWWQRTAAVRAFDDAEAIQPLKPDPEARGLMRRAFTTGDPVWISDLSRDSTFKRQHFALEAGFKAAFALPLVRRGEVLGVLEFFHHDVREPDEVLVNVATSIGSQIAQYIVRTQAEEAVKFMAMHDALTGLPNRLMFNERLARAIAQARRHGRTLAVLFVDLDRFKIINDTLGHDAGDALLKEAAQRLTDNLRAEDSVARLGGDEFVILLAEVSDPLYVGNVSRKLIDTLAAPFTIAGREYCITASIGVSAFPADGTDPPTLLKNADIAMYRAKERGKNCFEFYSAHVTAGSLERLSLESGLRRALEAGEELTVYYQPQIEACTGRIVGMEALVRWNHPELGLLPPARFIKLAEETGLIVPLGEWVLHQACCAHREWRRMHLSLPRVAVNLSPRQFLHAGLLNDTMRTLRDTKCSGKYVELEITESMVMHDPTGAVALIKELKALGVRIAMDDFGTGYSSLAYLRRFPIDSLKVDRSFLTDVPHDPGNVAITQAIIAMARTLHLTVIAEGVETAAQFNFLRSRGCDEVQGHYFSPAVPFEEATVLLQQNRPLTDRVPATASWSGS